VLGISKVGSLKRTTEVVKHRSGGQNSIRSQIARAAATTAIHAPKRGITHDLEFEEWRNKVTRSRAIR